MASSTMALASSQRALLLRRRSPALPTLCRKHVGLTPRRLSCRCSSERDPSDPSSSGGGEEARIAKLAMVTLATTSLVLGPIEDAMAAKSGGRVGGNAFRSSAPRGSPRINNSRTNVFINPPVAPPLVGGYGYGYGVPFFGGWGWSPFSFFAPGPSVAVGIGGGFEFFMAFLVLGAIATVIRRFINRGVEDDDY